MQVGLDQLESPLLKDDHDLPTSSFSLSGSSLPPKPIFDFSHAKEQRQPSMSLGGVSSSSSSGQPSQPPVRYVQALYAEFIGSFFLSLLYGLASAEEDEYIALGFGRAALSYCFHHISGAYFSATLTLGAVLTNRMSLSRGCVYMFMQLLGAAMGGLMGISLCADTTNTRFWVPQPQPGFSSGQAFLAELVFSMGFTLVFLLVTTKHDVTPNSYYGLANGLFFMAAHKCTKHISGAALDPMLATALGWCSLVLPHNGTMKHIGIYWGSSILAAALAAFVYRAAYIFHARGGQLPLSVLLIEFWGTFFYAVTAACPSSGVAVGAAVAALVYMGDHFSGSEYNPAVTLAMALRFNIKPSDYWKIAVVMLTQILAATAATAVALRFSDTITYPHPDGSRGTSGALFFELFWTSLLVLVVLNVATPVSSVQESSVHSHYGIAIGFTILAGVYCAGHHGAGSGGVFNPAIGIGISVVDALRKHHTGKNVWVYLLGPMVGSALSAANFKLLHFHRDPPVVPP